MADGYEHSEVFGKSFGKLSLNINEAIRHQGPVIIEQIRKEKVNKLGQLDDFRP